MGSCASLEGMRQSDLPTLKIAPVVILHLRKDVREAVVLIRAHGIPVVWHLQAVRLARCCTHAPGAMSALFHLLPRMQGTSLTVALMGRCPGMIECHIHCGHSVRDLRNPYGSGFLGTHLST